jgi:hypothetical protein
MEEFTGLFSLQENLKWRTLQFLQVLKISRSRDTVVSIATSYVRPRRRSSSPGRVKNFLFSKSYRPALRSTRHSIQRVPGALSPEVKRPGSEFDHSPPTSAEVKKMWIYTPTPIRLHGVVLNYLSTGTFTY